MAVKAVRVSEVPVLDQLPENAALSFSTSSWFAQGGENDGKRGDRKKKFVVMGHRGSGMNMPEFSDRRMRAIRENTLRSFINAGKFDLDFVEFDVQVTKDGFPVIFHDVFLFTEERGVIVEKRVTDLTLDEFLSYGPQRNEQNVRKPLYRRAKDGRIVEWEVEDDDHLCTLKDVFQQISPSLGFNIELKFDNNRAYTEEELVRVIRVILQVVFEHGKERLIMFSSFQPDAALLVRKLQNVYPVFFLSNGGNEIHSDIRRNSLDEAIKLCLGGGLQGIVCEVKAILRDPKAIARIKDSNLSLITYGQLNNVDGVVHMQYKMGVEGVIVDVVEEIIEAVSEFKESDSGDEKRHLCREKMKKMAHCSEEEISSLFRLVPELMQQCCSSCQ
nr:glycerophosphodiester phosphodiesterase GDPD1, chloroplastic-like [Ipomoea batatas]